MSDQSGRVCSTTAHLDRDRMGWVAYAMCGGSALRENEREARQAAHVATCPKATPASTPSPNTASQPPEESQ